MFVNQGNNVSYDYIADNIYGQNSEYSSEDVAMMFKALTGQDFSANDIEQKFGKERITDFDLYSMVDGGAVKDGFLNPQEIMNFMMADTSKEASFDYLNDEKTSYSLEEVADLIRQQTGKIIDPMDLSKLVNGRSEITDFEMIMLLDHNRNGKAETIEMDSLISDFNINYDLEDDVTDVSDDNIKSLYQGDGIWTYSVDDFKERALNDFGITLSDDQVQNVFGDRINDRGILNQVDANKDGYISLAEMKSVFDVPEQEAQDINYLSDDKAIYSSDEVATLLAQATGNEVTVDDVEALTGGKTAISDAMMFNMFDTNKDGTVSIDEANNLISGENQDNSFGYLSDDKTYYTSHELSEELNKIDVDMTANDVEDVFGSDVITDLDILETLDKESPYTGLKDGILSKDDIL